MRVAAAPDTVSVVADAGLVVVRGWVRDASTGAGLEGTEVRVVRRTPPDMPRAVASPSGTFVLTFRYSARVARYVVEARRIGYVTRRDTLVLLPGPREVLEICLRSRMGCET